jgi:SAM-dependent methyltransferase
MSMSEEEAQAQFSPNPFDLLRGKWRHVPAGQNRYCTTDLLAMPEEKLVAFWLDRRREATTGSAFSVRGWYHEIYTSVFRGRSVLDLGAGMGLDGITYAQAGASLTFADIVPENLEVLKRLCSAFGITACFKYLDSIESVAKLPGPFDVIYAQGSLVHMPRNFVQIEVQFLLKHLPVGGRWVELAYPRERWQREGSLAFHEWGERTDGSGTPWAEWCDIDTRLEMLSPASFETVLAFNFHYDDFNWFDLIRRS